MALLGAVVITIVAIVAALGLVTLPNASGTFADAFAIGATGVTTWALAKATPVIRDAASRAQQQMMMMMMMMMDYAEIDVLPAVNDGEDVNEQDTAVIGIWQAGPR